MRMYDSVTRAIIEEMERGAVPWVRPWKTNRYAKTSVMPGNAVTGRAYSGINVPILWASADMNGYPTHAWLTFKQALEHDAHVRKGERGTHVVFTKKVEVKGDNDETERLSMLREYVVFNVAQIEGLSLPEKELPPEPERLAAVEAFVAATHADIRYGGDKACFVPSHDFVAMPLPGSFTSIASFHATELHELGHWSAHKSRLDRDLSGRFGTRAYAAEELVAEFTAAFLCAHLGIAGELRHAGYIENWLELLRHDNRAIFTAASKASQAADYLRSFSEAPAPAEE
jgi:antirestriction protein ArdC